MNTAPENIRYNMAECQSDMEKRKTILQIVFLNLKNVHRSFSVLKLFLGHYW